MALGLTAGIFQIPPHFLSHRFSPFGGEFREPMDPQGTPVPSQASILWGGGALSLLWRVLWLEAQAPPSAGTNRRERRGRLLSSHRRGGPGRVRGSVPTFPVWEWSRPVVLPGRSIAPLSSRSPVAWGGAGCQKATVKLPKLLETFPSEKSGKLQSQRLELMGVTG